MSGIITLNTLNFPSLFSRTLIADRFINVTVRFSSCVVSMYMVHYKSTGLFSSQSLQTRSLSDQLLVPDKHRGYITVDFVPLIMANFVE